MLIQKHYFIDTDLQRSLCIESGRVVRRIARFVSPEGDLTPVILDKAVWQERQDGGTFQNVSESVSCMFERNFLEALVRANLLT